MADREGSTIFGEARRMLRTSGAVGGIAARFAGQRLFGVKGDKAAHAEDLKAILGGLKGPMMKVAQFLSTVPDALPPEYAKELATLQNLSDGRLILGAGVGWLAPEFAALGAPFHQRGHRMDEGIALMRAVWTQDPVTFHTKYIPAEITDMTMTPLPTAPIPLWIGGSSEAALRRTIRLADGWHGWWQIRGGRAQPGAPVTAVSRSADKLDVFVIGTDTTIYTAAWEPAFADGWHGWWNLNGGRAAHGSYVTCVSRRANFLDVFVVGLDGRAYSAAWSPGNPWGGWWPMGK